MVTNEKGGFEVQRSKVELQSLPTRAYLDQTVVPILMQAMSAVAKERYLHACVRVGKSQQLKCFLIFLMLFLNLID